MQFLYQIIYHPLINKILLPVNRLFSSVTKFRLPPSGTIVVRLSGGISFKLDTNQTSYVTRLLYWDGADYFEYTPIFQRLVQKVNSFADIGANTGYYSILAAAVNKNIRVHSFEPAKGPSYYLGRNIELNHFKDQIRLHTVALSDREGALAFYEVQNPKYKYLTHNLGGVGSLKGEPVSTRNVTKVKVTTLDRFVSEQNIQKLDLIKMDTEGTEDLILSGAQHTISKFRPIIICETLYNKIEKELESIMKSHGYSFYNHINHRLHPVESIVRVKDDGVRDCFFVPSEKYDLIQEFVAN